MREKNGKKVWKKSFWFYTLVKNMILIFSKIAFRIEYIGRENIPKTGAVIIAPNHASVFDPPFLGAGIKRPVFFMAKSTLFKNKLFTKILRAVNSFPVRRSIFDRDAMATAVDLLKLDYALLIFPEGTRTKNGELQKGKPGIGIVSQKLDTSIIPVYIKGSFNILPKGAFMIRFPKVKVYCGKPIYLKDFNLDKDLSENDKARAISQGVMKKIAEIKDEYQTC